MYLDEQPVTAPARNLDLYATDVQRVEVLPGPQGTLFGASSQAGTIRLITNKPEFDGFDIGVDLSLSTTEYGEESETVETFINIPVNDRIAFRAAMYSAEEGGYIDNVPGTFTTNPIVNPASLAPAPRVVDPDTGEVTGSAVSYATANNTALVEEDFNDAEYKGARFSLRGLINEDWDVLLQHSEQELRADGVFDYDPAVGDLQASRFFPDSLEDEFGLTAWTLTGRLGMLDVVYTGGYLDREIEQSVDYTGYNNSGGYIAYYTCTYSSPAYITNYGLDPDAGYVTPGGRECRDPVKGAVIHQTHERNTHEVRINTPQDKKVRVTAGFFYDDFQLETQDDYHYAAIESLGFVPNLPMSTAVKVNPNARGSNVAFFNDVRRMEEQMAIFGEVSYDFSEKLELIAGFRYYDMEIDFEGSSNFGDGIFQGSAATNGPVNKDRGRDYDTSGGHTKEPLELDDVILKFTANYKLNDDMLIYGTYSEGFRPGGWNRGGGIAATNPAYPTVSSTYESDDVQNYEFGWKMTLMDGAMRFNGNAYYVDWTDMQVTRFDPQNVSILTFVENAADATIKGIEGDLIIKPNENLTVLEVFHSMIPS
jgi:outer membrane receptor protein involved in Fe transport